MLASLEMASPYFEEVVESPHGGAVTPSAALGHASSSAKANAISSKVTALLSSSFADSDIRDALAILDARGVTNTADTRRRLRQDVQKEVIDCNAEIVADFGTVADQLQRIGAMIATLNHTCDEMRRHVATAKRETGALLEEATSVMTTQTEADAQQDILEAFTTHYIISDTDLAALTSAVEPVDDRFFAVLGRVRTIHGDCEVLLESEDQTLGLELIDQTSRHLDAAFKKLYQWIQREFKTLDLEDPHISGSIRRALRVLAERPSLFHNCLDFFAEARERTLSDGFRMALTEAVGSSDGPASAKPIEFSTHDLLRYLGDMLAWVHSASVSEKECLEGLFISDGEAIAKGIRAGQDREPWSRLGSEDAATAHGGESVFDGPQALTDLVNRILAGICHTLGQRIEVAVRHNDEPALVYQALHLVRFYHAIFSRLLGPRAGLAETLEGLDGKIFDHFEHLLQDEADGSGDQSLPGDLRVPTVLTAALDRLGHLLRSLSDATDVAEVDRLLSVALTPFLAVCEEMADEIPDPMRRTIFRLNQGLMIRSSPDIAPAIAETSTIMRGLAAGTAALTRELVMLQHAFLLRESGLQTLLDSALLADPGASARADGQVGGEEMAIEMLQHVAAQLDAFLPNAQMDALDNLHHLADKHTAKQITDAAVQQFCDDFERVEQALEGHDQDVPRADSAVDDERRDGGRVTGHGHEHTAADEPGRPQRTVFAPYFPRTTAEVRVLLS